MNAVLFYPCDARLRPVKKELALEGVERMFRGITFPNKGLTFLYGHRNPGISYLMQNTRAYTPEDATSEYRAALIELHVEIGKWMRHQASLDDDPERGLRYTRFLNVARAKNEVSDILAGLWVRHLGGEFAGKEGWPKGPTKHPHLLDYAIDLPEFKHLAAIAYTVDTEEIGPVKVATVFDFGAIESIESGPDMSEVEIVLYR